MYKLADWVLDNANVVMGVFIGVLFAVFLGWVIWHERPIEGTVTGKFFTPAHYETNSKQSCTTVTTGSGKNRSSSTTCVMIPYIVFVGDTWQVNVCDEERCKLVAVTETRYSDILEGSHFSEK